MESLLEKLEEECTCSICYEIFLHPKTFSCLHTFCLSCLNKLAERHRADGAVPCPKCREHIPIPSDGTFNTRTTSSLHNRLVELLAIKTSSQKNVACGNCKKETADCSFCFECSKIYCSSCLAAHAVINAEHPVRSFKEFRAQDYQDFLQRPVLCGEKFHKNQPLVFYCKQCQLCLCQLCVVVNQEKHSKHKVVPLEEAAEESKSALFTDIEKLLQKKEILDKGIDTIDSIIDQIDANVNTAQTEVQQLADNLIASIKEECQATNARLETVGASRKEIANSKKSTLKEESEQLKDAIKYGQTLMDSKTTTELLRKTEVKKHFEELLNTEIDLEVEVEINASVKFFPENQIQFHGTKIEHLGLICTGEPSDPTESHVLCESLTAVQAGGKTTFTMVTKTSDGETLYDPEDKIELSIDPEDSVSDTQVIDNKNGKYELSFLPRVPGCYDVEVNLNDHNIMGSPFEINVVKRDLNKLCTYTFEDVCKPYGLAVSKDGEIAVTDRSKDTIVICNKSGHFLRELLKDDNGEDGINGPGGIGFNSKEQLIVAECENHCIRFIDKIADKTIRAFGREGSATGEFDVPKGVSVDDADRLIVSEHGSDRVQVFDNGGKFLFQIGKATPDKEDDSDDEDDSDEENDDEENELCGPCHCISYKDLFIVADTYNNVLKVFDSKGKFLYKIGEYGTENGQFDMPCGLVVDSRDNLLVCDRDNNRVQMFTIDGQFVGKTTCDLTDPLFAALLDDDKLVVTENSFGCGISVLKLI